MTNHRGSTPAFIAFAALLGLTSAMAADQPAQPGEATDYTDTIRHLLCEQVTSSAWSAQFGRPVMWGIPKRYWGSRELGVLAARIDDCRKLNPQAGYLPANTIQYYVRQRKDVEDQERRAEVLKELDKQNRAVLERERAVGKAEAEARLRREAAERAEKEAAEREEVIRRSEAEAERRRQQMAAAEKAEAESRERIEQAKRQAVEAEAREKAAKARAEAADAKGRQERLREQEVRLAKTSPEVRRFLAQNPQLLPENAMVSPQDICEGKCTPAQLIKAFYLATAYHAEAVLTVCNANQNFAGELAEAHRRAMLLENTLIEMYGVSPADMNRWHNAAWQKLNNPEMSAMIKGIVAQSPQDCYGVLRDTSQTLMLDFQQ